jgi:hypothetical protein
MSFKTDESTSCKLSVCALSFRNTTPERLEKLNHKGTAYSNTSPWAVEKTTLLPGRPAKCQLRSHPYWPCPVAYRESSRDRSGSGRYCRTPVLFGSGRSLEMVRAEAPDLSCAVPQDGNEFNSLENLKRQNKPIQNLLLSASQSGENALRHIKRDESSPLSISDFFRLILDRQFRIIDIWVSDILAS